MGKIKHLWNNLFGTYAKGEIAGYFLGYDVAKEEYSVKYEIEINIYDEFQSFKEELEHQYGIDYVQKTEQIFAGFSNLRESVPAYIISHANHAKMLKFYQIDGYRIIYLIKMLTEIYLCLDDLESLGKAKSFTKLGMNLLDKKESYYDHLFRMFSEFKLSVMEKEWANN